MRNTVNLVVLALIPLGIAAMLLAYLGYQSANSASKKHELQMQILRSCQHDQRVADCVELVVNNISHAG